MEENSPMIYWPWDSEKNSLAFFHYDFATYVIATGKLFSSQTMPSVIKSVKMIHYYLCGAMGMYGIL